jgi:hypothetical protein
MSLRSSANPTSLDLLAKTLCPAIADIRDRGFREKIDFAIAPGICMKTKDKFWSESIAPAISMKLREIPENFGFSCDLVDEPEVIAGSRLPVF